MNRFYLEIHTRDGSMKNNIAWIVPTYSGRTEYLSQFQQTFFQHSKDVDLVIVYTHRTDKQIEMDGPNQEFFLEDYFSLREIWEFTADRSIINIKKILGLFELQNQYQGYICTDDEVKFFRNFDSHSIMQHFSSQNRIPVHPTKNPRLQKILIDSAGLFDVQEVSNLRAKSREFQLYGWFADLPFYLGSDISGFLHRLKISNHSDFKRLSSQTFDFILYQFYLINNSRADYLIFDWDEPEIAASWFEIFHQSRKGRGYFKQMLKEYEPLWVSNEKGLKSSSLAICVFHLDRERSHKTLTMVSRKIIGKSRYKARKYLKFNI